MENFNRIGFPQVTWSQRQSISWKTLFSENNGNLDQVVKDPRWMERFLLKRMVDMLPEGNIKPSFQQFRREMASTKLVPPGIRVPVSGYDRNIPNGVGGFGDRNSFRGEVDTTGFGPHDEMYSEEYGDRRMVRVPVPGSESLVDWLLDEKLVKVCHNYLHSTQAAAKIGTVEPCIVRLHESDECTAFARDGYCYRIAKPSYDALDFPWWAFVYGWAPLRDASGAVISAPTQKHQYSAGITRMPYELLRIYWSSNCAKSGSTCSKHRTSMMHLYPTSSQSLETLEKRVQAIFLDLDDETLTQECMALLPKSSMSAEWSNEEAKIRGFPGHVQEFKYLQCGPIAANTRRNEHEAPCGHDQFGNMENADGLSFDPLGRVCE